MALPSHFGRKHFHADHASKTHCRPDMSARAFEPWSHPPAPNLHNRLFSYRAESLHNMSSSLRTSLMSPNRTSVASVRSWASSRMMTLYRSSS
eukprot:scaffold3811_cov23-Tisochrysis_lutea.AAC.2